MFSEPPLNVKTHKLNGRFLIGEHQPNQPKHLDIKFIRRDQTKHRNGEACRASPKFFWSSLINLISKDSYMYVVFYLSCIISRFNAEKTAKQIQSRCSFV